MRTITDEHLQAYQEGGCLKKLFDVIKEDQRFLLKSE